MKRTLLPALFLLLCITFLLSGCRKEPDQAALAHAFVEKIFTIPSTGLAEAASMRSELDSKAFEDKILLAMDDLCGTMSDKEKLFELSGKFFQDVIVLHLLTSESGHSYAVQSVTVEDMTGGQFSYTVQVKPSNEDSTKSMTGSLRFNENNLVEYISIKSMT